MQCVSFHSHCYAEQSKAKVRRPDEGRGPVGISSVQAFISPVMLNKVEPKFVAPTKVGVQFHHFLIIQKCSAQAFISPVMLNKVRPKFVAPTKVGVQFHHFPIIQKCSEQAFISTVMLNKVRPKFVAPTKVGVQWVYAVLRLYSCKQEKLNSNH